MGARPAIQRHASSDLRETKGTREVARERRLTGQTRRAAPYLQRGRRPSPMIENAPARLLTAPGKPAEARPGPRVPSVSDVPIPRPAAVARAVSLELLLEDDREDDRDQQHRHDSDEDLTDGARYLREFHGQNTPSPCNALMIRWAATRRRP